MTEEMARNALLSFVNSKCCYGNRAAGELVIQSLKQQALYRYRLETFNESRLSEWTFEPFTNHSVDGPQKGNSPRPWDIKVQVPPMFQEETKKLQVPHSSTVKMRCATCSGAKRKAKQQRRCQMCSGSGRKRCSTCSGRGNKTCATCKGEKRLVHFIQLIITWKNNLFEFVSEHQLNFPGELLTKAKGENIFKDENVMRQTIELIPLTEVHYRYQGKTHLYYVYGMENKVYALDYPERYCCGCTII
ncbi:protein SSUH2 homolog isoform X1 [Tachyglossus aculeatus]|uniref:protein SSUH2 homolog isoform X1 n=1 Tax=Tachyglossus aculeatus TaxID=9261 RepID=UPI0018F784F6|nr:protein SSUH2 homolog isoform X1 [Tachyglossus aculeatus]